MLKGMGISDGIGIGKAIILNKEQNSIAENNNEVQ